MDDFMEESSFMLDETTTVEEYMHNKLIGLGLNVGEFERALEYARKRMDTNGFQMNAYLEKKQGGKVLVHDCWNTLAIDYKLKSLADLYRLIEFHTLIWCINYMHHLL